MTKRKKQRKRATDPNRITSIVPKKNGRPLEWTEERINIEADFLIDWINNEDSYFLTQFMNQRDLDPKLLATFSERSPKFHQAFEKAKRIQEERLVNLAVFKKGDPGFIKFILQNKAGWKEKQEVSGDAQNPLAFILEKIGKNSKEPIEIELDKDLNES